MELFFNKGDFSAFSVLDWVGVKRKRQDGERERECVRQEAAERRVLETSLTKE